MNASTIEVGELSVTVLSDGMVKSPADSFPDADYTAHADLLHDDGTMHLPVGVFVVRTPRQTVMIDAGFGRMDLSGYPYYGDVFHAGHLPESMAEAGIDPGEIDIVACTHLHLDHAGWLADGGKHFLRAVVRFGAADWNEFVTPTQVNPLVPPPLQAGLRELERQGRAAPIEQDGESVAPGVNAIATPGHTTGHTSYILSSGADRLIILGDAVVCPLHIAEPELAMVSETDSALARLTRESILRHAETEGARVIGPHFPGLIAGRVLRAKGRRYFST